MQETNDVSPKLVAVLDAIVTAIEESARIYRVTPLLFGRDNGSEGVYWAAKRARAVLSEMQPSMTKRKTPS